MSRRPLLYELVGAGMVSYAYLGRRTTVLGTERLRLEPGVVLAPTHLSDEDVPMLAATMYGPGRMWRDAEVTRPAFAVSNDLLLRGYLAGYPRGLPAVLRRALWPLGVGAVMQRWVRCLPVRFADRMRLVEALRSRPDLELTEALTPVRLEALADRAAQLGHPRPRVARDVLSAGYADLLWQDVTRADLDGPAVEGVWEERLAASTVDVRALIGHVRGGGALVLFPHGTRSPDGAVGPVDPRVARLFHAARPRAVQPIGIAHDPFGPGRARAIVAIGESLDPPGRRGGERELLAALRSTVPLTCGLVVAHALASAAAPEPAVEQALERARRDGRPIEPALERDRTRRARVREATRAVERLGRAHPAVARAALTYASMLEPVP